MKILVMASNTPDLNKGASGTILQTFKAMENLGCDVTYVWEDQIRRRIRHGNLHFLLELPLTYRRQLVSCIRSGKFDVVQASQSHGYLAAKHMAGLKTGVFIHRSHGVESRADRELGYWNKIYPQDQRSRSRKSLSLVLRNLLEVNYRGIAKYAHGHIVSASDCKDFLVEKYCIAPDKIAVIHSAAPEKYLENPRFLTADRFNRILHVSQFANFKAPVVTAKVLSRLLDTNPDIKVTWVCEELSHAKIRSLFTSENRKKVILKGWMTQEKLMEEYDKNGVFIFPSFFEGFGKAPLEAMTRGLCVVAANNSGMKDVIEHDVNGIKVETGDVDGMVAEVEKLIADPDRMRRISKAAIEISRQYTWDRVARETVSFYEKIISLSRSG